VYMPRTLEEGTWWERRGRMEIRAGERMDVYEVVEKFTFEGKEKISVKAGEFMSDRVRYSVVRTRDSEERRYEGMSWYVRGLGRILTTAELEQQPRMELVSFENVMPVPE